MLNRVLFSFLASAGLALAPLPAHAAKGAPLFPTRKPGEPLFPVRPAGLAKATAGLSPAISAQDTLDVYCIYVEFKSEAEKVGDKNDAATTTGLGTFGSDKDLDYKLDPNGPAVRTSIYYLQKHFDFARHYYETVSGGRVTVIPHFFPAPDGDGRVKPVQLPERMKYYNPDIIDKDKKQKISEFDKQRGQKLMTFIQHSIQGADEGEGEDNPFQAAKADSGANPSSHHRRVFMIFHAGHSRLVDGGSLGGLNADSPNDFTDFFVTKPDFSYLDSATIDAGPSNGPDKDLRASSKGVPLSTGDTLTEVMLLSESASQDKLNWGINGILVNQIGRALGMPDMFDIVRGFSQLGGFCMMDFAGYNSMNGFIPIYPSAWVRAFMGWETPLIAKPDGSQGSQYRIYAPGLADGGKTTTLRIPLNEREYLLVENRQRSVDDTVTLYFDKRKNATDITFGAADSVRVPFTFLDSIFSDSVCVKYQGDADFPTCKTKEVNKLRPEGIVTGASSYDLGLPGSGLLVWRVNDWFIDLYLKYGAVNAYLGDTLRSQYKGVELVEADGFLTIGKEFKDPTGQSAFDYGSGGDMLPHVYRKQKNPPQDKSWLPPDTLTVISPYGQANTNAWNDARTHIRLLAVPPENPRLDKGLSSFTTDSVFTFRDSVLTLRVDWADNQSVSRQGMVWPKDAAPGRNGTALLPLRVAGEPYVLAVSDQGFTQIFHGDGRPALLPRKYETPLLGFDSVFTAFPDGNVRDTGSIPVTSLADSLGPCLGAAAMTAGDSQIVAILTEDALHLLYPIADSLVANPDGSPKAITGARVTRVSLGGSGEPGFGVLGPVAVGSQFWILTRDGKARAFNGRGEAVDSLPLPGDYRDWQALGAYAADGKQTHADHLAVGLRGGHLIRAGISDRSVRKLDLAWGEDKPGDEETFTLAFADFNRDGACDAAVLGSRGHLQMTSLGDAGESKAGKALPGWPQVFPRSVRWTDTAYRYTSEDFSSPAVADLDGDRYPDLIFTALNSVYALDRRGARLPGWPVLVQPRQNVGLLYGSSTAPEAVIGSTPIVLSLRDAPAVFIASPDGLILGVDAKGKRLTRTSYDGDDKSKMGPVQVDVADWPLSVGGLNTDTLAYPFLQMAGADLIDHQGETALELLTFTGTGGVDAITVKGVAAKTGQSWLMPGGDATRGGYLSLGAWQAPAEAEKSEGIRAFWLYPSPVRGPKATVHLEIGAAAEKARIRVYDLAGNVVKTQEWRDLAAGRQPDNQILDLKHLGPDVYSVLCEVWFPGGKKQKWERIGVVR